MLRRYDIRSHRALHSGWAIIVLDTSIGYFSTVSDYGNYAYAWSSPGIEFRRFITQCEDDYLLGKLLSGRRDREVYDPDATKKAVADALEHEKDSWSHYAEEMERFESCSFSDKEDFYWWYQGTKLDDAHELIRMKWNPQAVAFTKYVMPRFRALLREEIVGERCHITESGGARCELHAGHAYDGIQLHSFERSLARRMLTGGLKPQKEHSMGGANTLRAPVGFWYQVQTTEPRVVPIAEGTSYEVTVPDGDRTRVVAQVETEELANLVADSFRGKM